jgi:hypothetical protein
VMTERSRIATMARDSEAGPIWKRVVFGDPSHAAAVRRVRLLTSY